MNISYTKMNDFRWIKLYTRKRLTKSWQLDTMRSTRFARPAQKQSSKTVNKCAQFEWRSRSGLCPAAAVSSRGGSRFASGTNT